MDRFEFGGWVLGFGAGHTVAVAVRTPDGDLLQCGEVTGESAQMVAELAAELLAVRDSADVAERQLAELRTRASELAGAEDAYQAQVDRLAATERQLAEARAALRRVAYDVSVSMPAAWNDEPSWYRSQLMSAIGIAARALDPSPADEEPTE